MNPIPDAPVLDIDPYAIDVLANPYAFHQALREAGPVVLIKPHGVYAVGRYDEAVTVLTDYSRFTGTSGVGIGDARKPGQHFRALNPMLEVDPPQHTSVRRVANKVLSPVAVRQWRIDMENEAQALAERILDKREVDGVEDIAEAFVFKVFPEAMGIKFDRDAVLAIGAKSFNETGPKNALYHEAVAAAQPFLAWFEDSYQAHSALPGGIAEQFFKLEQAGELQPDVASGIVRAFIRGGTDSTISGILSTLNQLARQPAQWRYLQETPAKIRAAFDEGIRFESPFQVSYRATVDDTELGGCLVKGDTKIGVYLGAANRDPRKWPNAESFDVTRQTIGQVAFGVADHNCIGQMIARLECECLLSALLKRVKTIELNGEPSYRLMNQMRTLGTLPLRVTPL